MITSILTWFLQRNPNIAVRVVSQLKIAQSDPYGTYSDIRGKYLGYVKADPKNTWDRTGFNYRNVTGPVTRYTPDAAQAEYFMRLALRKDGYSIAKTRENR